MMVVIDLIDDGYAVAVLYVAPLFCRRARVAFRRRAVVW